MDYKEINTLLNKYFEGKTSLYEEELLQNYFSQDKILPEHTIYRPLFLFYEEERGIKNPSPLHFQNFERKKNYKLAIAVVFILGIGLFGILIKGNRTAHDQYVKNDSKKEIYKEVKKYSYDLNKGLRQLSTFSFVGKTPHKNQTVNDTINNKKNKKIRK
jgi:hypothetical protein